MRAPCGCRVAADPASGVLRSARKCRIHAAARRDPATLDESYYRDLGLFAGGQFQESAHKAELFEALGPFPEPARPGAAALEVGCGLSPYASTLARLYDYHAIDASASAVGWMRRHRVGTFAATSLEVFAPGRDFALVLAAHVLEHVDDAPGAVARLAGWLEPGGELWAVVPDDSDLMNPDHLWFFTEATLRACVERSGLSVLRCVSFRRVKHEDFIYLKAARP